MFKFLRDKIKKAINSVTKKAEEEGEKIEEPIEDSKENIIEEEKKSFEKFKEDKIEEPVKSSIETKTAELEDKPEVKEPVKAFESQPIKKDKPEEETIEKIPEKVVVSKPKQAPALDKKEEPIKAKQETKLEPEAPSKLEEIPQSEEKQAVSEQPKPKKSLFSKFTEKISKIKISESKFDEIFWDLEISLMENNVAIEVVEKIKSDLKNELVDKPVPMRKISNLIESTLKESISNILTFDSIDLIQKIKQSNKPYVILFLGINGSGKTTTIAKIINLLKKNSLTSVVAASDTFRAAAIDQLNEHANKLGVKMIKHDYGADPAAVAFDAIKYAKAKAIDVVLIDTAGRMHSNVNLMDELKKIIRVSNPNMKLFIGDALTGNDCVEQAQMFDNAAEITGSILSKSDADEKGGTAVSLAYVTKKPLLYLGTGQTYDDLTEFDKNIIMVQLGFA